MEKAKSAILMILSMFAVIMILSTLSSCSNMGGFVDTATQPGTDSRCFVGLGMEFCYYRERTVTPDE